MLRLTCLPIFFREIIQKNKVTILLFHDIEKDAALKCFQYLSKKYNIISLNEFINAVEMYDRKKIPHKALILTFDDGHINNYEILPLIKEYNLPITIFLCSSLVGTNRHFWFKFNEQLTFKFNLKQKSNSERVKILSEFDFVQDKEFEMPQALRKDQINEMKNHIDFQSHTMFHPILPKCDYQEARTEIFKSKEDLENEYELEINAISYPNGDYCERDIELVREAGYKCGLTVDFGFNTIETDIFRLKRISVNDTNDINELIVKASGLWAFIRTKILRNQKSGLTKSIDY